METRESNNLFKNSLFDSAVSSGACKEVKLFPRNVIIDVNFETVTTRFIKRYLHMQLNCLT